MHRLLLLMLLAPLAHAQPARPPAPRFVPSQDAPHTVGQPGHTKPTPAVEPGPQPKRVLPETPETRRGPGIWAGDRSPPASVEILLVPIPLPSFDEDPSLHILGAIECTERLADALLDVPAHRTAAQRLTTGERECAAAMMLLRCLAGLREGSGEEIAKGLDAASRDVAAFGMKACVKPNGSDRAIRFASQMAATAATRPSGSRH